MKTCDIKLPLVLGKWSTGNLNENKCPCIWFPKNRNFVWMFKHLRWRVLAMVLDSHFRSGSRSEQNLWKIGSLGCQYTWTVNSGTVGLKSPYSCEVGRMSVGPSVDLYNVVVFAVGKWSNIEIRYSTANNPVSHVLQSATSIILEYMFFLL